MGYHRALTGRDPIRTSAASSQVSARSSELRILGLITLTIVAYWPTSGALWHYWTDDLFFGGHGLLVAALALWLLWRARGRIALAHVQGELRALCLLLPCSIVALILWKASIEGLQFLMLPLLMLLGVWTALGPAVTRVIAVPVGFLYFAMPAWNVLAGPLQSLTLWMAKLAAPAIGVPATVSGSLISLPDDMKFNVGLVCSGVGFLVQGLAVAALLGELEQASLKRRMRLLGAMAVVAIVANWIRVLAIVHVGYSTQMRHVLVTRHHLLFGYVLFVVVLVGFVWIARPAASPETPRVTPPALRPSSQGVTGYFAAVGALLLPPLLAAGLAAATDPASARGLRLPAGRAEWTGPLETTDPSWRPVFVGSHEEWRGAYRDLSGHTVEVLAVGYSAQAQGRELVNEDNSLIGNDGLTPLATARVTEDGKPFREDVVADASALRSVIWSIYVIGDRPIATPLFAQLWYGINAFGTPPYSALFALRTACSPSCAAGRAVLASFVRVMPPGMPAQRPSALTSIMPGRDAPARARAN